MALTKEDISQISELFNQGFEQLILPRFDIIDHRFDKVDERLNKLEKGQKSLQKSLHDHVFDNEEKYQEAYKSIGHYRENTPSRDEFKSLKERVFRLEKHHQ